MEASDPIVLYEESQGVAFVSSLITRNGEYRPFNLSPKQLESRRAQLQRLVRELPESCILCPARNGVTYLAAERRVNSDLLGIDGPPLTPLMPSGFGYESSMAASSSSSSEALPSGGVKVGGGVGPVGVGKRSGRA